MPRPHPSTWLPLLDRALESEIGIRFRITGIRRDYFKQTLYTARKATGDHRYMDLVLFEPAAPFNDEIWICRKQVELDASA